MDFGDTKILVEGFIAGSFLTVGTYWNFLETQLHHLLIINFLPVTHISKAVLVDHLLLQSCLRGSHQCLGHKGSPQGDQH